ncbi:MAG: preprotein translocase subunit SecA [Candidatus Omnitrophica bacterium]|nr:preprotein translocase subunit SecA [Candidatus Omnitrophota bacterium]
MFDFLIRKSVIKNAQKFIDRLEPKVNIHLPMELPLPSVGIIKKMTAVASKVNSLESEIKTKTDDQLRAKTQEFRLKIQQAVCSYEQQLADIEKQYSEESDHETRDSFLNDIDRIKQQLIKKREEVLDAILPEAFAVVREAAWRTLKMRHFDVQLVGGMILHKGNIVEMATGEGKTLVATLPTYLNALAGKGAHVITVNDYLAKRDKEWMAPVYEFLGLTVGVIQHDHTPPERKKEYGCDITYGTNNEFGFDYLRDNMVSFKEEMVQRSHHFAVADEVDSILIDEARTPLIISGPAEESTDKYYRANQIALQLKGRRITEKEEIDAKHKGEDLSTGFDYAADEKARSISMTEQGEKKAAQMFGIDNLHDMETIEYRHHILQALKAREFFRVDVDYVIRDGQVIIVDEFTGRMMPGRRWSDGLHQAVEAKEGIKIERENQTLATVTFQNYFRMYEKLSGMTGTAYTEASEFKQIYKVDCIVLPTNRILQRKNHPDCIYKTEREKFKATADEIAELHAQGRPILVGTISIEKSELLSSMLKQRGIEHQVLNAKYHDLEAHIVAQAGRYKAVTIATNMAGRGTDIVLGGNAEHLAKSLLESHAREASEGAQPSEEMYQKFLAQFKKEVEKEHAQVIEAGGLHVLGTERHESRRIDNQLRGRSGRQGDPGSSRFFVSLEDDLMRLFGSDRIMGMMNTLGMEEGQVIEHPLVSRAIEIAQKRVETHNFEIRKQLLEYDNVMNRQREVIYQLRRSILEGEKTKERIFDGIHNTICSMVPQYLFSGEEEVQWDIEGLMIALKTTFRLDIKPIQKDLVEMTQKQIEDFLSEKVIDIYEQKEKDIGSDQMRHLERIILLQTIDSKWKDHLYAMDQLKEGIGLRAFAHKDPLVEYQHEAFSMFEMMYDSIMQDVVEVVFKVEPAKQEAKFKSVFNSLPQELVHTEFSSLDKRPSSASGQPTADPARESQVRSGEKVGRNDPCPCGSGKKYKKCCGT